MLDPSPQSRLTSAEALNNCFFIEQKNLSQDIKLEQDE
jgi:hypothetical protein